MITSVFNTPGIQDHIARRGVFPDSTVLSFPLEGGRLGSLQTVIL
jgi:hypothetical protein